MSQQTLRVREVSEEEAEASCVGYQGNHCCQPLRLRRQMFERIFFRLSLCELRLDSSELHAQQIYETNASGTDGRRSQLRPLGKHVFKR